MLRIKYKSIVAFSLLITCITILNSCKKDFFEVEDPNGIEDELMWQDPGAIGLFLNRTYNLVIPQWPTLGTIHTTSDEMNNANTAFLYGTLTDNSVTDIGTSTSITANRYADIRRCNVAIEGLNEQSTFSEADKNLLKGQFFFLRAYTYFKLVRLYGGVPLVLKSQQMTDDNLQVPRSKTSECVAAIVKDLDSAAMFLPKAWLLPADLGRITKAAAMAVKGKVLLYWASPQFNINNDASRWTAAYNANKAAYDTCVAHSYILLPGYSNIFTTEDHKEILIVRKYNTSPNLGTNIENITRPYSESSAGGGSNQPTWNLVKAYLKSDGTPTNFTDTAKTNVVYNDTLFWLNRDPRFSATVAFNGALWALSGKIDRRQWSYTGVLDETSNTITTGFYCRRFCNPTISPAQAVYNSNSGGGNGMDWIEMRFAEVVLNLAECAVEVGNITEAKNLVKTVRQRAGIVQGKSDYGLGLASTNAEMRSLILNERQVEFALEGMRNFDLRRTRNLQLITTRLSYKVTLKSPYVAGALPSSPVATNIYVDVANTAGERPRDTININHLPTYIRIFNFASSNPATIEGSNVISIPSSYYVYPLPNLFTQTPGIQQTMGWPGGSFNPYE